MAYQKLLDGVALRLEAEKLAASTSREPYFVVLLLIGG